LALQTTTTDKIMKKFCFVVSVIALAAMARPTQSHAQKSSSGDNSFFLRTNLIHWVTLTPDLGFEYRYKDTYAILLSGSTTPGLWTFDSGMRWGLSKFNLEGRYYTGVNKKWYIGLGYQQGVFNFYNPVNNIGRQANLFALGVTGGYMLKLSESLSLDFNLGLGYAYLDYFQKYHRVTMNGNDMLTLSSTSNEVVFTVDRSKTVKLVPTVTQIGVSLVWKM